MMGPSAGNSVKNGRAAGSDAMEGKSRSFLHGKFSYPGQILLQRKADGLPETSHRRLQQLPLFNGNFTCRAVMLRHGYLDKTEMFSRRHAGNYDIRGKGVVGYRAVDFGECAGPHQAVWSVDIPYTGPEKQFHGHP